MARQRPTMWGCDHHYPIEVSPREGSKRARCLGCGAWGPLRADTEVAMRALRNEARDRHKEGA